MNIEERIQNPICIKFGKNENVILADDKIKQNYPLIPGAVIGEEHYGFILIIDTNNKQKELVYPTQCKINGIGIDNGVLKIFEEHKAKPWIFTSNGKLEQSNFNEFSDDIRNKVDMISENSNIFEEYIVKNPINIKIDKNPCKSEILADESCEQSYPLHPGAVIGGEHYGFILTIETQEGTKEIVYPTQGRVDGIEIAGNPYNDLKVYENGKYKPWIFTYKGQLKEQASHNKYFRGDKEYISETYDLDSTKEVYQPTKSKR